MTSSEFDITIIIPCFNNQSDIDRLTSRLTTLNKNNNHLSLQVIVVDDGSKEAITLSVNSTNRLSLELFRKDNGGVSLARNYGLERAKGKFTVFIDSDDDVEDDYIGTLANAIENYECEVLYFPYSIVKGADTEHRNSNLPERVSNTELLKSIFLKETFFHICSFLFSTSFLKENKLIFNPAIRLSEDVLFIVQTINKARNVYISKHGYFKYIENDLSVINSDQGIKELNHIEAFKIIKNEDVENLELEKNYFLLTCALNQYIRITKRKTNSKEVTKSVIQANVKFSESIGDIKIKLNNKRSLVVFVYKTIINLRITSILIFLGTVR